MPFPYDPGDYQTLVNEFGSYAEPEYETRVNQFGTYDPAVYEVVTTVHDGDCCCSVCCNVADESGEFPVVPDLAWTLIDPTGDCAGLAPTSGTFHVVTPGPPGALLWESEWAPRTPPTTCFAASAMYLQCTPVNNQWQLVDATCGVVSTPCVTWNAAESTCNPLYLVFDVLGAGHPGCGESPDGGCSDTYRIVVTELPP